MDPKGIALVLPKETGAECPALSAEATGQGLAGQGTGSRLAAHLTPLEEQSKEAQLKLTNSTGPKVNPPGTRSGGQGMFTDFLLVCTHPDVIVPSRRETGSEEGGEGQGSWDELQNKELGI